ncbi:MAG TPA: BON domain-containing protein [Steroidobacteraceae bacterium]|nr:BON domain-containing protein [Steroidobacteraceae bacterium]
MRGVLAVALLLAGAVLGGCAAAVVGNSAGSDTRNGTQLAGDAATSADVKARLLADPSLKPLSISVMTYLGQVTLAGLVDSDGQRELAGRLAAGVKGVKGVRNDLTVK